MVKAADEVPDNCTSELQKEGLKFSPEAAAQISCALIEDLSPKFSQVRSLLTR